MWLRPDLAALLHDHPCSVLCSGGEHVDLVYVAAATAPWVDCGDLRTLYETTYGVDVLDVRRVEAPPPRHDDGLCQVPLTGTPDVGADAIAYGVRWTLAERIAS